MLSACDIVVDCAPGDLGVENLKAYQAKRVKAIFQGGEEHEAIGWSFNSSANYAETHGKPYVRVVSCNTTGLIRSLLPLQRTGALDMLGLVADEDAARLGQSFEDERRGHDGEAGEVVREVVFGKAKVLDRDRRLARLEGDEPVDPDPAHGVVSTRAARRFLLHPPVRVRPPAGEAENAAPLAGVRLTSSRRGTRGSGR